MPLPGESETPVPVAYLTKWALTKGIVKVTDAKLWTSGSGASYLTKDRFPVGASVFETEKHWTPDLKVAQARAAEMLKKKVASLQKQVEKLSKLRAAGFKVVDL